MKQYRFRPAFSMLELIFVIVILGIVSSLGSEMIAKVYESYIVQRAEYRASIKTELAAKQIANRLASAIPGTIVRRSALTGGTIESINDAMSLAGDSYIALQWVGAEAESFNATSTPGWSGFCDIDASNKNSISTPGSDLSLVNTISTKLGKPSNFAIYFPYDQTAYYGSGTSNLITLDNNTSHIVEHYKLARTSYALVAEVNGRGGKDLYLYYNFIPTPAIDIPTTTKSLLLANFSSFKFKGAGRTIRFKICKQENIGEDFNVTDCKEKAVF